MNNDAPKQSLLTPHLVLNSQTCKKGKPGKKKEKRNREEKKKKDNPMNIFIYIYPQY